MKRTYGFTLIETVVVIAIMMFFAGLSMTYFNGYAEEKKLESEEKRIIDVLELAKKKAQVGDTNNYVCGEFSGYEVVFAGGSYFLKLCCDLSCGTAYTIQEYKLGSHIAANITGDPTIMFLPVTFRANIASTVTVTIKNSRLNKCIPIYIYPSGLIDEGPKTVCS